MKLNEWDSFKDIEIPIDKLSKVLSIDFSFYIQNIQKNYLVTGSTRGFIMNYPLEKMKANKKTGLYPKTVSIPSFIKQFLTDAQKDEIITTWFVKFALWGNGEGENFVPVKFKR